MNAITVDSVSKRYRKGQTGYRTLREDLYTLTGRLRDFGSEKKRDADARHMWALRDVSFEVKPGERVGIIGRNGSGKTTLLRLLAGVTRPTYGTITVRGRLGVLIEIMAGFHPELTGRENIYLNGAIMGMSRREIKGRFDEIVAFAELGEWIDTPIKRYSSGMHVRLGFAVAAHLDPDILLIDEVLAVGDAQFQKRCLGKMETAAQEGHTVLFVSHNMASVENLCQRGILLHQGQVQYMGTQTEAIAHYLKGSVDSVHSLRDRTDRVGSGAVRVVGIELKDIHGDTIDVAASGQDICVYLYFESAPGLRTKQVVASLMLKTNLDMPVFLHHNRLTGDVFGELPECGAFVCRLQQLPLTPSTYRVAYSITGDGEYLDGISDAAELSVVGGDFFGSGEVPPASHGFCLVKGSWHLEPGVPPM